MSCLRRLLVVALFLFASAGLSSGAAARREAPPSPPKLLVLVVFDQLRGDYLTRWRKLFGPGGFERLMTQGAWFSNCHYPYANTSTGPGHASLGAGCPPRVHGIVGNGWYDRAAGTSVYCATLGDRYQRVPPRDGNAGGRGGAPERLLVATIGDLVKQQGGRVVALSLKDRGCVLLAGRQPDAVYWFDDDDGRFVTSTYYRAAPHQWVTAFNQRKVADRWFHQPWQRLRGDISYDDHCGPDDVAGEGKGVSQGITFPHPMTGGATQPGSKSYQALYNSPFANEMLWELTQMAIEGEQLGRHEACDLLCVSFSANDPIGHCWGPDSHEVLDVTLRSDRLMKEFLDFLDRRIGRGQYVLALSADHGVVPLPEVSRAKGLDAGRITTAKLALDLEKHLQTKLGQGRELGRWLASGSDGEVYFNERTLTAHGLPRRVAEQAAKEFLQPQPGVLRVITRSELQEEVSFDDVIGRRVLASFHPERSGDVFVIFRPYYLPSSRLTGTSHGTPHPYDTHVPLLVLGPDIPGGEHADAVTPLAAGVILADAIGATLPGATVPFPASLRRPAPGP